MSVPCSRGSTRWWALAYYLAARAKGELLSDVYGRLVADLKIKRVLDTELPAGVTAQLRTDGVTRFVFLMNFRTPYL